MARRVGALLGLLCAFGAARQSPYEPAQEGWDFSIGTYWMQMDEDLCGSSASRVGVPAPAERRVSQVERHGQARARALLRAAPADVEDVAAGTGERLRRRLPQDHRRRARRPRGSFEYRRETPPPPSDHRPKPFRKPLAPRSFAKYDLDETGEIEFDELREELVQDIMNPYMEYTKDKPMDNVVPKA